MGLADLQAQLFREDVALGQRQAALEGGGMTGLDWLNAGSSVLGSMMGGSAPPGTAISSATINNGGMTASVGGIASGGVIPWYVWAAVGAGALYLLKRGK